MISPPIIPLESLNEFIQGLNPKVSKVFVFVDKNTHKHCLPVIKSCLHQLESWSEIMIGHGESSKSMAKSIKISHELSRRIADRNSLIINLGGGVVSDLGGFVASIFKRGIRFINVPTSLIGMVDASHGGKTAVNSGNIKNQIGTFQFPEAVIIHIPFLQTLSKKHLESGFAEMLKHGLISDASYFDNLLSLSTMEFESKPDMVYKSIEIKQHIVELDPYEKGTRSVLNVGHSVGHALESYFMKNKRPTLSHGHAIALGIVMESTISNQLGELDSTSMQIISKEILSRYSMPQLGSDCFQSILRAMKQDKKNVFDVFQMPLLTGIGSAKPNTTIEERHIVSVLRQHLPSS